MFNWENHVTEKLKLDFNINFQPIFVELIINTAAAKMPEHGLSLSI